MPNATALQKSAPTRIEDVACPFCPLLCDDLTIDRDTDGNLQVVKNGCPVSVKRFETQPTKGNATVGGERVSHRAALEAAVKMLRRSRQPLISGLGTDVEGMREVLHLADLCGGIVDQANSAGFDSGIRVLQTRGWIVTTLGELRNRSDLVVLLGVDIVNQYANFMRRFILPRQTLVPARRRARQVYHLGAKSSAPASSGKMPVESLNCDPEQVPEVINILRALVAGRRVDTRKVAGASIKQLQALADAIGNAEYPVFVWAPGQLPTESADLTIHAASRLIDDLNKSQRAAGLILGGDGGGMSAANVCAWQTGFPLHISFAAKEIDYDPVRFRTSRLLANDEVDTVVWIDAFGEAEIPPGSSAKTIVVGLPGTVAASRADIFIPAGTPGVDHAGTMVRTDAVVSIALDQLNPKGERSVRKVVHDMIALWNQ